MQPTTHTCYLRPWRLLLPLLLFAACNSQQPDFPRAENALDAGREFIDGCLKGHFDKAAFYMLPDATNRQNLEKISKNYQAKGRNDQEQYKQASIVVEDVENLNDSVTIIHYKNSFDKIARKIKVIQRQNSWLVDFKYTFDGNM